jgi:hypothetical protein
MDACTRIGLIAWTVVACAPTTPTTSSAGDATQRPQPASEPTARSEPASEPVDRPEPPRDEPSTASATHAITIAPRSQTVTANGPPKHVWFEVTNASAAATIRIVALEIAAEGEGANVPVAIADTKLDDVDYPGDLVPIGSGSHVLDFGLEAGKLAPDRPAYTFVLRALVGGREVVVEHTVHRARREPIRR